MESFNPDEPKYRCCCNNFHVERGAYIIAIVGIVLSAISVISSFFVAHGYANLIGSVVGLLLYISIIYAQRKQNPSLYLPFLIFNAIGCVLIVFYIVALVAMFIWVPEAWRRFLIPNPDQEELRTKEALIMAVRFATAFVIVIMVISEALGIWFQYVVYRAYQYMKLTHSSLAFSRA